MNERQQQQKNTQRNDFFYFKIIFILCFKRWYYPLIKHCSFCCLRFFLPCQSINYTLRSNEYFISSFICHQNRFRLLIRIEIGQKSVTSTMHTFHLAVPHIYMSVHFDCSLHNSIQFSHFLSLCFCIIIYFCFSFISKKKVFATFEMKWSQSNTSFPLQIFIVSKIVAIL